MSKILFVCWGNVGRSQIAQAYYNHFTSSQDAVSAGTDPTSPPKYPKMASDICELMLEENIDVSNQHVKLITQDFVDNAEKIYVLCRRDQCPNYLLESNKVTYWNVKDPEFMNFDDKRIIRNQIKDLVLSIT